MIPLRGQQRNEDPFGAHLKLIALSMLNRQLLRAGSLHTWVWSECRSPSIWPSVRLLGECVRQRSRRVGCGPFFGDRIRQRDSVEFFGGSFLGQFRLDFGIKAELGQ